MFYRINFQKYKYWRNTIFASQVEVRKSRRTLPIILWQHTGRVHPRQNIHGIITTDARTNSIPLKHSTTVDPETTKPVYHHNPHGNFRGFSGFSNFPVIFHLRQDVYVTFQSWRTCRVLFLMQRLIRLAPNYSVRAAQRACLQNVFKVVTVFAGTPHMIGVSRSISWVWSYVFHRPHQPDPTGGVDQPSQWQPPS